MTSHNARFFQAVDTIALHLNVQPRIGPVGDGAALIHVPTNADVDTVADHFGVGSTVYAGRASTRVTLAGVDVLFLADQP